MPSLDKDTLNSLLMVLLAIWGGVTSYLRKKKNTGVNAFIPIELIEHLTVSGFTGVIVALLCKYYNLDFYISAAIVGMSGHMGSKVLDRLELEANKRNWFPGNTTDKEN